MSWTFPSVSTGGPSIARNASCFQVLQRSVRVLKLQPNKRHKARCCAGGPLSWGTGATQARREDRCQSLPIWWSPLRMCRSGRGSVSGGFSALSVNPNPQKYHLTIRLARLGQQDQQKSRCDSPFKFGADEVSIKWWKVRDTHPAIHSNRFIPNFCAFRLVVSGIVTRCATLGKLQRAVMVQAGGKVKSVHPRPGVPKSITYPP